MKCKKCGKHEGVFGDPEAEEKKLYCINCKDPSHVDLKNAKCKTCGKRATFGIKGTKTALYCATHKGTCVNVSNPVCITDNCSKRASFGIPDEKVLYCSEHAKQSPDYNKYVNLCSVRCKGDKYCPTSPVFGLIGTTKVLFCKNHIPKGQESKYINLRDKCKNKDCIIQACFGLKGTKKRMYCLKHIPEGDENKYANIKDKTCEECDLRPTFAKKGEKALHCDEHKKEDEVNVVSKRCLKCKVLATYGEKNTRTVLYCFLHKEKNHVNVKAKFCEKCGKTRALYNYPGLSPKYCQSDATSRMVIFPLTRQKEPDVNCKKCDSIVHYNEDFCKECKTEVKEKPKRRVKEKEDRVEFLLKSNDIQYIRDCIIGKSKKRPDYLIYTDWGILILEVDEFQHRKKVYTEKELERMRQIYVDCNCENVLFVRYNPDKYKTKREYYVEGVKKERFLIDTIDNYIYEKQPEYPLSNIYLFYDNFNLQEDVNEIDL